MARSRPSNKEEALRAQIFALLNKEKASADMALKVLAQCQSHVRNWIIIGGIGKEQWSDIIRLCCKRAPGVVLRLETGPS